MTDQSITGSGNRSVAVRGTSREDLLARHREARRRRDAAPLGSEAFRRAALEVGEIEIEIAALDTGVRPSRR